MADLIDDPRPRELRRYRLRSSGRRRRLDFQLLLFWLIVGIVALVAGIGAAAAVWALASIAARFLSAV